MTPWWISTNDSLTEQTRTSTFGYAPSCPRWTFSSTGEETIPTERYLRRWDTVRHRPKQKPPTSTVQKSITETSFCSSKICAEKSSTTTEELDNDFRLRNKLLSDRFLEWIGDEETDNVAHLVEELRPQYRAIFSRFDKETLIEHMRSTLLRTFERRFRAAKIREFVDNQYAHHTRAFSRHENLKSKIYAVVEWYEEHSTTWCTTELFPECRLLEERPGLFRKLEGNENVLVTEIVPSDLADYWGEVGGKTIKICSYRDLNVQFYITEGLEIDHDLMSEKRLKELRDSFLRTIIARRYVFADAIDHILNYTVQHTGMEKVITRLSSDPGFRELRYRLFYHSSKLFLGKIYDHVIKRLSATERRRSSPLGDGQQKRYDRRATD
jgi:hypothetical protein